MMTGYTVTLLHLLMLCFLIAGAWQDVKTHFVSDWITLPFAGLGLVAGLCQERWLSCGLAGIAVFLVLAGTDERSIGGADTIVLAGLTASEGIGALPVFLICSMAAGLLIAGVERFLLRHPILTHGNRIAFLPAILLSLPGAIWYIERVWRWLVPFSL